MIVTRHSSAESFLEASRAFLMTAEAENNLIIGVAEGLPQMQNLMLLVDYPPMQR